MKRLLTLLVLITGMQVVAQKTGRVLVDSLTAAIPHAGNDTIRIRLYNRVFNELLALNTDEALSYAKTGLKFAEKMKWPKGIGVFLHNIAGVHSANGNYDSAIFYYKKALSTNPSDKYNTASTLNNMGNAAQNIRADYTAAADYYFKALRVVEDLNDSAMMATCQHNLTAVYMYQQNFVKALASEQRVLTIREKVGTADEIAASLELFGKIYYTIGDQKKAREYLKRTLATYETTGNTAGLASAWSSLSLTYGNDYRSAIEARLKARDLWNEISPMHINSIINTGNIGVSYLDVVRYDTAHSVRYGDIIPNNKALLLQKAEGYLQTAISQFEQVGETDSRSYFLGVLAELQEVKGDYKNAYYNYKAYSEIQDSIYSQDNKNKIAAAESQREIDKKNDELKINQLALTNQRKTMWGLTGGLALLGIIGGLLYHQNRVRKRNNQQLLKLNAELDEANKIKARFFGILSHDLRKPVSNLVNFLHLQKNEPGLLSEEQAATHEKRIASSAETLLETMEGMLLWSKSQMERFAPEPGPVTADQLFDRLQKAFASDQQVSLHFINEMKTGFHTDENYLFTILYNLTANGAAAAVRTGKQPVIILKAWTENGSGLLSVTDNGPGFPVELTGTFNEIATQANGRNGLGMVIIKDLAKAINCKITLSNTGNGGVATLQLA